MIKSNIKFYAKDENIISLCQKIKMITNTGNELLEQNKIISASKKFDEISTIVEIIMLQIRSNSRKTIKGDKACKVS